MNEDKNNSVPGSNTQNGREIKTGDDIDIRSGRDAIIAKDQAVINVYV